VTSTPVSLFHPIISSWFEQAFGKPTDVQLKAWPEIAAGRHVLITAPTGSGKTLTAFLWSIHQLMTGIWPRGQIRVIYVSPLKALNNDIYRNLTTPLSELEHRFRTAGEAFSPIRVSTRSGDTPQAERRRLLRHPPEILITTPESLNILISSKYGRRTLSGVCSVILDEIHAVVTNKRGTHLMTAVDRLIPLCGEFQRIALSATVKPLNKVAEFIGGYQMEGNPAEPLYRKRNVATIRAENRKKLAVGIHFPENAREQLIDDSRWPVLVAAFKTIIQNNRSTLLFANSRRLTEKVTRLINENEPEVVAYSHHGSLSKEIRLVVEHKLKTGDLKAIVATNSLELGIDIGDLDQVVLIQSPLSVSSAIQRIGRSGHRVGQTSQGRLYPTHGRDFLNAAVLARCIVDQDIEKVTPVDCPLDVLAQVILAMTAMETWNPDELYSFIRTSSAYHRLSRRQFDLVLEMLAGRYADTRLRELKPRISIDRLDNTVRAKAGALMLVYLAGGTIPDRGYFDLRLEDTKVKIGELDEEFVWERNVGETFALGTQTWRIMKITHNDVHVVPAKSGPGIFPFWKAEKRNRDFHLSDKIGKFLELANIHVDLKDSSFRHTLKKELFMADAAACELISFLRRQKEVTAADLPHRHHLLIEHFNDPLNKADSKQVILHTIWGGRINRPFAMALSAAWEKNYHYSLEVFADDDCILLILPHRFDVSDTLKFVNAGNVETLLTEKLEKTGFFGARFRENAGRALLLPKANFKNRMPLWLNRLRSKKLLDAVIRTKNFPILLETWRTCLRDEFDLENLKRLLDELSAGKIKITQAHTTAASPFSGSMIWQQTNKHMYEDDTPGTGKISGLSRELLREIAGSTGTEQRIPGDLIRILGRKLHRTATGYAPASAYDLLDWVKERLLIPEQEWRDLLSAVERDHALLPEEILSSIGHKMIWVTLPGASFQGVCAIENLQRMIHSLSLSKDEVVMGPLTGSREKQVQKNLHKIFQDPGEHTAADIPGAASFFDFLDQWLVYYGPVDNRLLINCFGLSEDRLEGTIDALLDNDRIFRGFFRQQEEVPEICNQENYEILLRMARKARQPEFKPLAPDVLPLFLASFQGLTRPGDTLEDLQNRLYQLFGVVAPAGAWEEFILPARLNPYFTSWLDSLMPSSGLSWFGGGDRKIGFAFSEDLELFLPAPQSREESDAGPKEEVEKLMPDRRGRYSFFDIINFSGLNSEQTAEKLWALAWQGELTNDNFAGIRMGVLNKFKPSGLSTKGRGRRGQFNRWKSSRPLLGNWYRPEIEQKEPDLIEQAEIQKDRLRQLFRRYGILFREILQKEQPLLRWGSLFKTLRLMELSGEILSGYFFEGITGLQFMSHEAFRFLQHPVPEDTVFWMNAADPASLCGLKIDGLDQPLPPRLPTTYLVFHGRKLVIVAKRNGKHLDIHVPHDHPPLPQYFSFYRTLTGREFNPKRSIVVETINNEPSLTSGYAEPLLAFGFSRGYKGLELRREY